MTTKSTASKMLVGALCALAASGCATDPRTGQPSLKETFASDDPCSNNARNIGIGAGAILGVIVANQFKHSDGARLVGAALGATVGGMIGHDMDARRCALAKIAGQYQLDITLSTVNAAGAVIDDAALDASGRKASHGDAIGAIVDVREPGSGSHFETNSDVLTPRAQEYFSAIADAYNAKTMASNISDPKARADYINQISKRRILLVGHTDDTGNSQLNADLSERRARSVSDYLAKRGLMRESLYFQGAGESYPVASNANPAGRAKNRRVEIIEIVDQGSFDRFLTARKPRYEYYRNAPETTAGALATAPAASRPATLPARTAERQPALATKTRAARQGAAAVAATKAPKAIAADPRPNTLDFGGVPLAKAAAIADVGRATPKPSGFSLISSAYADEPAVLGNCTLDRPRVSNGVKALADGKTYRTSEHLPGLYGKTWTDQVNGHQLVVNRIAVLANDGSLAHPPEFKVYANYDSRKTANPVPSVSMAPEVNTYLGSKGVLYRMFLKGRAGLECADIVFSRDGGTQARDGVLVYSRGAGMYAAEFKPQMYKK